LIERAEIPKALREDLRRLTELDIPVIGVNGTEVGMIRNIECLCAKLSMQAVTNREGSPQGDIGLPGNLYQRDC
jgi:hypothetical protein